MAAFALAAVGRSGGKTGLYVYKNKNFFSEICFTFLGCAGEGEGEGGRGKGGERTYVTFPTDHLLAVVFAGEGFERGFDEAAAETEDEVEG